MKLGKSNNRIEYIIEDYGVIYDNLYKKYSYKSEKEHIEYLRRQRSLLLAEKEQKKLCVRSNKVIEIVAAIASSYAFIMSVLSLVDENYKALISMVAFLVMIIFLYALYSISKSSDKFFDKDKELKNEIKYLDIKINVINDIINNKY